VKPAKDLSERVREFLSSWKQAWERKNLDEFIKMYHPKFEQGEKGLAYFKKKKQNFFNEYKIIRVELDKISAKKLKYGLRVRFLQSFRGDDYSDKGWKTMVLAEDKDRRFRIISEEWRSVNAPPSDS
jgi:murein L,D-transpeptidase YafK